MADRPKTCVVVSYWTARPDKDLLRLLRQMMNPKFSAGVPFSLVIVCNGGDQKTFTLPAEFAPLGAKLFPRENTAGTWGPGIMDGGWPGSLITSCSFRMIAS